jgi:hypothetical protein
MDTVLVMPDTPTATVAVREVLLVLAVKEAVTVPLPLPFSADSVSQAAVAGTFVTAQAVLLVTINATLEAAASWLALAGLTTSVGAAAVVVFVPSCVMVAVCLSAPLVKVSVVLRTPIELLAAKITDTLLVVVVPIVTQLASAAFATFHVAVALTLKTVEKEVALPAAVRGDTVSTGGGEASVKRAALIGVGDAMDDVT